MKKLFFTAIAVVAFSGSAMASNAVIKFKPKSQITAVGDCTGVQSSVYIYCMNEGFTASQSTCIAKAALKACLSSISAGN